MVTRNQHTGRIAVSEVQNDVVENDEILTEAQAARFMKVSRMTLQRWRTAGAIGCYRPGGWRVTYSRTKHLLPFLESCEEK